jgi:ABC-2 type transport system permease protein
MTALTLTHARFHLLETVRVPMALIASVFFPAAAMLFFVVPFGADDGVAATYASASMATFAIMMTNLFGYGVGVAAERALPWDSYSRTLPAGPGPRFAGRLLAGSVMTVASVLPVVVIAALFTEATTSAVGLLLGTGAAIVAAVPFTLMGLAIGYGMPMKAALAVSQILFFPLAFLGGLMSSPTEAPEFVQTVAPYLPTRGTAELMWAAVTDHSPDPTALFMLGIWTVALAALASLAYRLDQGRRFR